MTPPEVPENERARLAGIGRRELYTQTAWAILRTVGGLLVIALIMVLVPDETDVRIVVPLAVAVIASAIYVWFFTHQIKRIQKARYPMLRAGEALILIAAMFLAIFSIVYLIISRENVAAFTEPLDSFSSYYFSLTVLATVGFGDITPVTTAARSVTMLQMALDIAFFAVVLRIVAGAAKKTIDARNRRASNESKSPD